MKNLQIIFISIYISLCMLQEGISYTEHTFNLIETEKQLFSFIQQHGYIVVNFYDDSDVSSHIWEVKFRKIINALKLPLPHIYEVNCNSSDLCVKHNIHTFPIVIFYNKYNTYKIAPKKKKEFAKLISNFFNFSFKVLKTEKEYSLLNERNKLTEKVLIKSNSLIDKEEFEELLNVFRLKPNTNIYYLENDFNNDFLTVKFTRITDLNKYNFDVKIPFNLNDKKEHFVKLSNLQNLKLKPFRVFELDDLLHNNKPVIIIYLDTEIEAVKEEELIFKHLKENIHYFYIIKNSFNQTFIESHSLNKTNKYLLFKDDRKYRPKLSSFVNVIELNTGLLEEVFVNSPLQTKTGMFPVGDYRFGFEELNNSHLNDLLHSNESGIIISYLGELDNNNPFTQRFVKEIKDLFKNYKKGIFDKGLNDHKIIDKTVDIEIIGFTNKEKLELKKINIIEKEYKKQLKELIKWFNENKKDDNDEEDL